MTEEKRDETAEEEEKARLGLEARKRSIGHALRRAAGLPDEEDPFVKRSDEADLIDLNEVVAALWGETAPQMGRNPRAVEAELEAVRRDIKRLKKSIASLGSDTRHFIASCESPEGDALNSARMSGDFDRIVSAHRAWQARPREQRTISAAILAMDQLDAAIVPLIEQAIEASARLPKTGRIPNYHARNVAYLIALYVECVTGSPPGLWTGSEPSGPFARALQETFEALDIKASIQRPGEYATAKLSEDLEF